MQQEVQYIKEKRTRAKKRELIVLLSMQKRGVDLKIGRLFCIQKQNQWKWDWRKRRMKMALMPNPLGSKEKTAKKLYAFLLLAVQEEKWHHVEWGFETLKLIYAQGYAKSQDAGRLGALVRAVDEKGADECALRLMNAFALLCRCIEHDDVISALIVTALYAYRNRKEALLAKCGDCLCRIAMDEERLTDTMISALKQIGILAIKHQDDGLFREIMSRTLAVGYLRNLAIDKLIHISVVWLEKILERGETSCYEVWKDVFEDTITQRRWTDEEMLRFIESCRLFAGLSAMNPYAAIMQRFLADMLRFAQLQGSIEAQITAVQIVGMAMRIAVHDHPPILAIPYVVPLVKFGADLAHRQMQYPKLYMAKNDCILLAVWQVFLLLEQELQENTWSEACDKLRMLYENYRDTFPMKERELLWWRSLFTYRMKTEKKAIPSDVKRLKKQERIALIGE